MSSRLRLFVLMVHVVSSVGWLGAVSCYLALTLVALPSPDAPAGRAAYVAMDLVTRLVIVPLALGSSLSGIVSSLGTSWGLLRHYWVLVKVLLALPATLVLLLHTAPIGELARVAEDPGLAVADLGRLRAQLFAAAAAAVVVLVVATALSVYKPRGRTSFPI
ncbi:MAG: hypothetical protein ABI888_04735 [Chloroflexota bacterium]